MTRGREGKVVEEDDDHDLFDIRFLAMYFFAVYALQGLCTIFTVFDSIAAWAK